MDNQNIQEVSQDKKVEDIIDQEYLLDDEEEGRIAQEKATLPPPKINMYAYPTRQYFDQTVTPLLLDAMKALAKERLNYFSFESSFRPNDPIEFFSYYLLIHNPFNEKLKDKQNQNQEK